MEKISSTNNETVKQLVRLSKASERRAQGLFLVDGAREIEMASQSGIHLEMLFHCPELMKEERGSFGLDADRLCEVSASVFEKICYKERPDGYLALARMKSVSLEDLKLINNPLLIVLEGVEKPGNLGAIMRTAFAVGADGIIINESQTDIYNPNVIRASEGFIFQIPTAVCSAEEAAKWLKHKGIKTIAAATTGEKSLYESDLNGPIALVFGTEADGLSTGWLKAADEKLKIPMEKGIDSLNVSVSAAIMLYEARRQRGIV